MFKGVKIGKKDIHDKDICEGNALKFKSVYCGETEIEGIVRYKQGICKFVIDRKEEGFFEFNADVINIEIVK